MYQLCKRERQMNSKSTGKHRAGLQRHRPQSKKCQPWGMDRKACTLTSTSTTHLKAWHDAAASPTRQTISKTCLTVKIACSAVFNSKLHNIHSHARSAKQFLPLKSQVQKDWATNYKFKTFNCLMALAKSQIQKDWATN